MKLSELLDSEATLLGDGSVEITGIGYDSRGIEAGELFAALSGTRADGHLFIPEALARGAVALLGDDHAKRYAGAVPVVLDANPRLRLSKMAAAMYPGQPAFMAAVTGTNGKTSVASFTRQIWDLLDIKAASLGTLGVESEGRWPPTQLTTPDPVVLHRLCSQLAARGIEKLIIEASSHGLDQFRLDALKIHAAAFTNLSRDHYDYHGTPEAYFKAKARLFDTLVDSNGTVVLNADVDEYKPLAEIARQRGLQVIDYGYKAKRFRIEKIDAHQTDQEITLELDGRRHHLRTNLVGGFQAYNMLGALGLAMAGGVSLQQALSILPQVRVVPGRMQLAGHNRHEAPAFVDYAHTPDALQKALQALRAHTSNRLIVVFGCGGDRDIGKRPVMGEIASRLADKVYVTDDNPRNEDPAQIRRQILAVCDPAKTVEIGDRAKAIYEAFADLGVGDALLVAGKGHEAGQTVAGVTLPFDDSQEIKRAARSKEVLL